MSQIHLVKREKGEENKERKTMRNKSLIDGQSEKNS